MRSRVEHRPRASLAIRFTLAAASAVMLAPVIALGDDLSLPHVFGRTHPILVHFPVALLLVAALVEFWAMVRRRGPSPAATTCVIFGTIGAAAAALAGWLNAAEDQSGSSDLEWHRWFGIGSAIVTLLAAIMLGVVLKRARGIVDEQERRGVSGLGIYRLLLIVGAAGTGVTGHFGGTITHGPDYLPIGRYVSSLFSRAGNTTTPEPPTRGGETPSRRDLPGEAAPTKPLKVDFATLQFPADGIIDFDAQVRPILEATCIQCHGAKKRRGGLRLDSLSAILKGGKTGPAIVVGDGEASNLYFRVTEQGNEQRMPLDMEPLSDEHTRILKVWIDQGAKWGAADLTLPDAPAAKPVEGADNSSASDAAPVLAGGTTSDAAQVAGASEAAGQEEEKHWSYVSPIRPSLPSTKNAEWARNEIDLFVLAKLEKQGLHPSPEVERGALLRRVSLDLTGLPPTPDEIDSFLSDASTQAYESVVDRLLASPAYGERWARPWLDLARYADSMGHEKDQAWTMWPYRDWVIKALNADMPFDRFTIEQLAGDLLPTPERDQLVATGFHRCSMINEEGGVDPEEARVNTVIDRTNTTATVWLGTTLGCAQCHDHKYDPFTQKDYYSFFAFFNSTPHETKDTGSGETIITSPKLTIPRPGEEEWKTQASLLATEIAAADKAAPDYAEVTKPKQRQLDALNQLINHTLTTQVMQEMGTTRETHIFVRGSFLNPGAPVEPSGPSVLPVLSFPLVKLAPNRLDLARWLVNPENPLTSRVQVNRMWAQYFGRGLVATEDDFGTRGDAPTHPELLDWLATEFIARGWSQKAVHRLIVTSATYRQSSHVSLDLVERDPANKFLARGPRFRLDAEAIRDQALAIGGLLSMKMGGPSVFPPQPDGLWGHYYSPEKWTPSTGEDRYRRAIYTYWKRATPYPSFVAFDAPQRQVTCTRRARTNTPLQALTTLNDPAFVEAAIGLARRAVSEGGVHVGDRVNFVFRVSTGRMPKPEEFSRLANLYQQQLQNFAATPGSAHQILSTMIGGAPLMDSRSEDELAAWTVVANVLLNLDEVLTKG